MTGKFQAFVFGVILAVITGWLLFIGKDVLVPVVFGAVVVYVIVGLTHALQRVPLIGPRLPVQLRYLLSIVVIGLALLMTGYLLITNRDNIIALAPGTAAQEIATLFGIETEPTWATLRQDMLARINIQVLLGSMLASVSSIAVTIVVVLLYAVFLLVEQHGFDRKLAHLADDPGHLARLRGLIDDINLRVGSYLALKTVLSVFLGAVSWVVMRYFNLEFTGFWAVLIAIFNFVPYLGSVLGVMFPAIMAIVQFADPGLVVSLVVALTVVQFLIGNFLDPCVMGNSLNLSPFAILVSLAVWSELWGIPGAFLALPITAILVTVLSKFASTRPIAVLLSRDGSL